MWSRITVLYGWTMPQGLERSLGKNASVTVEAAARLVDIDVETIRHWSDIGSIEIEQRGDMDVVRLDRVRVLTESSRARRDTPFGLLRALLRDAPRSETPSVIVLQELAREKAGIA
jgi:DNA-binding transcriptional MerR regulator